MSKTKWPGTAPGFTRDEILACALGLADECGIEAVSARKLAAALGCAPMTLYTYFSGIGEIRAGVVALAFREVDADPVPGERWDDTLRRTMGSIRAMYLRHRYADLYKVETSGYAGALAEHTARIYGLHEAQGIPAPVLKRAWCVIDAFLGGFIPAELAELNARPTHPDPEGRAWMQTAEGAYTEESFTSGVEIIVAGICSIAAPDPCEWRTPLLP